MVQILHVSQICPENSLSVIELHKGQINDLFAASIKVKVLAQ